MNEQLQEFITVPDVAHILNVSASKVRRLIEDRHLAGIYRDGVLSIPASFLHEGELVTGVRGTLILLEDMGLSIEQAVEWVLTENEELGQAPIAALQQGHKAPVRRAAQVLV